MYHPAIGMFRRRSEKSGAVYFLIFWIDMEIHLVKMGKATYKGEIKKLLGSQTGRGAVRPGGRHV